MAVEDIKSLSKIPVKRKYNEETFIASCQDESHQMCLKLKNMVQIASELTVCTHK